MIKDLDVVYRDIDSSDALTHTISEKYQKLSKYSEDITHSKVTLDTPHNHNGRSGLFRASIDLTVKGRPIAVSQDDASVHVAVRNAFSAAERKLKSMQAKIRSHRAH